MNILLIEDNLTIAKGLAYTFSQNNYQIIAKTNIKEAKNYLKNNLPNLIILDVMLPDGNGFAFFQDYLQNKNIPVIFLTARDDEDEIASSLMNGAEDYLIKPFRVKELLARVNKVLNRVEAKNIIKVKDITFDLNKMILKKNAQIINLTSIELKLIYALFLNINKVVRRGTLVDIIFDATGNYVDDHTLTVYFKRIREKIASDIIVTIKGVGYRIDNEK